MKKPSPLLQLRAPRVALAAGMLAFALSASAQASAKRELSVAFASGETARIVFSHGIEMRIADQQLILSGDNVSETYQLDSVRGFTYSTPVSVGIAAPATYTPVYTFTPDGVHISLPETTGNICRIYTTAGEEIAAQPFDSDLLVDLSGRQAGLYIIRVNSLPAIKTFVR